MQRVWAMIERDLRRFRRSPTLLVISLVMPIVQLVVLGYAFGGTVKHLRVGVVDQDRGLRRSSCASSRAPSPPTRRRSRRSSYADPGEALAALRDGPAQWRADDPARLLAPRAGEGRSARSR